MRFLPLIFWLAGCTVCLNRWDVNTGVDYHPQYGGATPSMSVGVGGEFGDWCYAGDGK